MHVTLIKPVYNEHLSYVILYKCCLGRSHETGFTVYLYPPELFIWYHNLVINNYCFIGKQIFGSIKYSGTVFVSTEKGENYVGIVFGYVNNRKFYLLSWKQKNYNYELTTFKAGIKGINLKVYINQWWNKISKLVYIFFYIYWNFF